MPHSTKGIHRLPSSRLNSGKVRRRRKRWSKGQSSVTGERSNSSGSHLLRSRRHRKRPRAAPVPPRRLRPRHPRRARPSNARSRSRTASHGLSPPDETVRAAQPRKRPQPWIATSRSAAGTRRAAESSALIVRRILTFSLGRLEPPGKREQVLAFLEAGDRRPDPLARGGTSPRSRGPRARKRTPRRFPLPRSSEVCLSRARKLQVLLP